MTRFSFILTVSLTWTACSNQTTEKTETDNILVDSYGQRDTVIVTEYDNGTADTAVFTIILNGTYFNRTSARKCGLDLITITNPDCPWLRVDEIAEDTIKSITDTDSTLTVEVNIISASCYGTTYIAVSLNSASTLNIAFFNGAICQLAKRYCITFHFRKIKDIDINAIIIHNNPYSIEHRPN